MSILMIRGELEFVGEFRCNDCGKSAYGGTEKVLLDCDCITDVVAQLSRATPKNFPMHWASFYSTKGTVYCCPDCTEVRNQEARARSPYL